MHGRRSTITSQAAARRRAALHLRARSASTEPSRRDDRVAVSLDGVGAAAAPQPSCSRARPSAIATAPTSAHQRRMRRERRRRTPRSRSGRSRRRLVRPRDARRRSRRPHGRRRGRARLPCGVGVELLVEPWELGRARPRSSCSARRRRGEAERSAREPVVPCDSQAPRERWPTRSRSCRRSPPRR